MFKGSNSTPVSHQGSASTTERAAGGASSTISAIRIVNMPTDGNMCEQIPERLRHRITGCALVGTTVFIIIMFLARTSRLGAVAQYWLHDQHAHRFATTHDSIHFVPNTTRGATVSRTVAQTGILHLDGGKKPAALLDFKCPLGSGISPNIGGIKKSSKKALKKGNPELLQQTECPRSIPCVGTCSSRTDAERALSAVPIFVKTHKVGGSQFGNALHVAANARGLR